jgi:hypothetical protein
MLADNTEKITITAEELNDRRVDDVLIRKQMEINTLQSIGARNIPTLKTEWLLKAGLIFICLFFLVMLIIWVIMNYSRTDDQPPSTSGKGRIYKASVVNKYNANYLKYCPSAYKIQKNLCI